MLNGPRIICDNLVEIGDYTVISWNVILMDTGPRAGAGVEVIGPL